jgi:hypothetical protein
MKGDVWSRFSRKISSSGAAGSQCTLRLGKSKAARELARLPLGIDRKTLTYSLEKAAERGAGPAPAEKPEPAPSPLAIDHAPQIASVDGAKTRRSTSTCTIAASRRRSDSARSWLHRALGEAEEVSRPVLKSSFQAFYTVFYTRANEPSAIAEAR